MNHDTLTAKEVLQFKPFSEKKSMKIITKILLFSCILFGIFDIVAIVLLIVSNSEIAHTLNYVMNLFVMITVVISMHESCQLNPFYVERLLRTETQITDINTIIISDTATENYLKRDVVHYNKAVENGNLEVVLTDSWLKLDIETRRFTNHEVRQTLHKQHKDVLYIARLYVPSSTSEEVVNRLRVSSFDSMYTTCQELSRMSQRS